MKVFRVSAAAAALALATAGLSNPQAAFASQSHVAVNACHAKDNGNGTGTVPSYMAYVPFMQDSFNGKDVLCGDGKTWGAVHIELKHRVANWDVTQDCLYTVHFQGKVISRAGGKVTYRATYPGGSAIVVTGTNGVITAYPEKDSGSQASWELCSEQ